MCKSNQQILLSQLPEQSLAKISKVPRFFCRRKNWYKTLLKCIHDPAHIIVFAYKNKCLCSKSWKHWCFLLSLAVGHVAQKVVQVNVVLRALTRPGRAGVVVGRIVGVAGAVDAEGMRRWGRSGLFRSSSWLASARRRYHSTRGCSKGSGHLLKNVSCIGRWWGRIFRVV